LTYFKKKTFPFITNANAYTTAGGNALGDFLKFLFNNAKVVVSSLIEVDQEGITSRQVSFTQHLTE